MRNILLVLVGGLMLSLTACGRQSTRNVSGTVTFNGEPVAEGYIAFLPTEEGGTGGGGPIVNGQYTVRVKDGKNRVEITATKMMPLPPGEVGMYGEREQVRQYLPERYNASSELEADVSSDSSDSMDFELMQN